LPWQALEIFGYQVVLARDGAVLSIQDNPAFKIFSDLDEARAWVFQAQQRTPSLPT
jgi:hypothetical protein